MSLPIVRRTISFRSLLSLYLSMALIHGIPGPSISRHRFQTHFFSNPIIAYQLLNLVRETSKMLAAWKVPQKDYDNSNCDNTVATEFGGYFCFHCIGF